MASKNKTKAHPQSRQVVPHQTPQKRFVPELGKSYTFTPAAFLQEKSATLPGQKPVPRAVTGEIIYINWAHSYFTVEYEVNGYKLRQGIKF